MMKAKSIENIHAADLLIENGMLAASVHCSYYSGFQFSKFVLSHCCGISYENQEAECTGRDSHSYVSNKTAEKLILKNRFYGVDYYTYYNTLKMLRKKADYTNEEISEKEARRACNSAKNMITLLTQKFSII